MTQQINLLGPQLRKPRRPLASAIVLGPAAAVLLVLGLGFHGVMLRDVKALRAELDGVDRELKLEQDAQAKLAQALATLKKDAALEAEVVLLERRLAAQRANLETLKSGVIGDTSGFSEYMRGFARQSLDGLWLTGFSIAASGAEISVEGRSLRAELVPAYIKRLGQEKAFAGRSFEALTIGLPDAKAQAAAPSAHLAFSLTAKAADPRARGVAMAPVGAQRVARPDLHRGADTASLVPDASAAAREFPAARAVGPRPG